MNLLKCFSPEILFKFGVSSYKKNLKKISNWNIDLTNKWKFRFLLLLIVIVFTFFNNYYFYKYVGGSVEKDVSQLKLILNGDLEYFRSHKISGKQYREHTKMIVAQFYEKAQYNKSITLNYQNALKKNGQVKNGYKPFSKGKEYEKVTQSVIKILVPELNSNEQLDYNNTTIKKVSWFEEEFLLSVFNSMTLSIGSVNNYIEGKHKGYLHKNLKKDLIKNFEKDRSEITFSKVLKTVWHKWESSYWPRSRNPAIFLIVLWVLFYRIRKYQVELSRELQNKEIELGEKKTELEKKQDEIDEKQDEIDEKQDELENKQDELEKKKVEIEKKKVEIKKLEEIISKDQNEDIQKIISCIKNKELKELELLLKTGVSIDTKDSEGMTALMLYFLENNVDKDQREVIKILLENGANIDEKNYVGMTALMLCSMRGGNTSVQVLIDNGADTAIKQEVTAADLATPSIKELISKTQNTNPQELIEILSHFTHSPLKFTTHNWDFGSLKSAFGTFDEAMEAVRVEFKSLESELKKLDTDLWEKIDVFLFNKDTQLKYSWCSNPDIKINIGWSSLDGLKEHCDSGKNAFTFDLKERSIMIEDERGETKQISTFGDVIEKLFKHEIEMRTDNNINYLEKYFYDMQEDLAYKNFQLNLNDANLNKEFYTDTQKIKTALDKIFLEIEKRNEYQIINLTTRDYDDKSFEIIITQIGSYSNKNAEILLSKVIQGGGDLGDIRKLLKNLCDWSIETAFEDKSFRINYLHSNNVKDIEQLANPILGFTHRLRFYR